MSHLSHRRFNLADTMSSSRSHRHRQSGIIMVIALITLAIMMIGAVAALRSMNASLANAGNVGIKRDMANQAEVAMRTAMTGLNGLTNPETDDTSRNYSAAILPVTPEGIPTVLVGTSPSTLDGKGVATNVVNLTTASALGSYTAPNVTMYYVIDRLCQAAGAFATSTCLTPTVVAQGGNSNINLPTGVKPLYRVTVRVDGPRGAQSFYQATMSN